MNELETLIEKHYKRKEGNNPFDFQSLLEMVEKTIDNFNRLVLNEETSLANSPSFKNQTYKANVIPIPNISEIAWGSLSTPTDAHPISDDARYQLARYLKNIEGANIKQKIQTLNNFFEGKDAPTSFENNSDRIQKVISYLVFYKTLTTIITNFNASSAGFAFESFLAVLLDADSGRQIPAAEGSTIADIVVYQGSLPISLKLYSEGSLKVGGSYRQLVEDLTDSDKADLMQYIAVTKDLKDLVKGDPLSREGTLTFYGFNFTLDNVANIILSSMAKSVRCIEISSEFIRRIDAGETDYDFSATLPAQETLSIEKLETRFIEEFKEVVIYPIIKKGRRIDLNLSPKEIDWFTKNPLDWANNDEIFTPKRLGEDVRVVRGRSPIQITNPALDAAVTTAFGEAGYDKYQLWAVKKAVVEATAKVNEEFSATELKSQRAEMLSGGGVFADARASVKFYNGLTDPELKRRALLNTKGRLSNLQFDLNRGNVYNIQGAAGTHSALPDGQGDVNIGEIKIGAVYVQEILNKLTAELNQSIFSLFQSVKDIQEGTYAFMAGGLSDDNEARKAITASNDVAAKTEELSSDAAAAAAQPSEIKENNQK